MIRLYAFGARVAVAASYLTLAFADPDVASDAAGPYAALVLSVAVYDLARRHHRPPGRHARTH